jgi:hypothetical protein
MSTGTQENQTAVSPGAPPQLDEATQRVCLQKGQEYQDKIRTRLIEVAAANGHLLEGKEGPWVCPGPIEFKGFFQIDMEGKFLYPPGPQQGYVKFEGHATGLAAVHGASVGFATLALTRNEVVGEVTCQVNAGGVGPGIVEINWWRGNQYVGTFVGGGAIEGVAIAFGKGRFDLADRS